MAGIYLHIPFCKTRCIYCDFYSSTQSYLKDEYIDALCQELEMRKEYLNGEIIETIYFGGGTPSQLSIQDFQKIFQTIERTYGIDSAKEITLEANPDDLSAIYLQGLSSLPFNRLSIGIQTFQEETLRLLKRRHTSQQATEAIHNARRAGFDNISIDLMYGLPEETPENWLKDLHQALRLRPEHISAYHLIYEEETPIFRMLQSHQIEEADEDSSLLFFKMLIHELQSEGYEHYEISNFCRPNKYSIHNTSYWQGVSYLGCGASAHSYNGKSREWNVADITSYIIGIKNKERHYESEHLELHTQYNDSIITSLRTRWGIFIPQIESKYGSKYAVYCLHLAKKYLKSGDLKLKNGHLLLTPKGIFISDSIMSDLLWTEEN